MCWSNTHTHHVAQLFYYSLHSNLYIFCIWREADVTQRFIFLFFSSLKINIETHHHLWQWFDDSNVKLIQFFPHFHFHFYIWRIRMAILDWKEDKKSPISKMSERKAVIKNADMSEDMQQDAVDCATQALEKYNIEKVHQIKITRIHLIHLSHDKIISTRFLCLCQTMCEYWQLLFNERFQKR